MCPSFVEIVKGKSGVRCLARVPSLLTAAAPDVAPLDDLRIRLSRGARYRPHRIRHRRRLWAPLGVLQCNHMMRAGLRARQQHHPGMVLLSPNQRAWTGRPTLRQDIELKHATRGVNSFLLSKLWC